VGIGWTLTSRGLPPAGFDRNEGQHGRVSRKVFEEDMSSIQTKLTAEGITCGGCANSIKNALGRLEGVGNVEVDVPSKTITVEHDDSRVSRETVVEALDKAGFEAS